MAERLTEIRARKELAPARGQTILWDADVKGFALRITPGGAKSFLLDYRVDGRQRRITIGSFPDWSVQAARSAAKRLKQDVDAGRDPMGQRHADRVAPTLQDVWERYQAEHLFPKGGACPDRRAQHVAEDHPAAARQIKDRVHRCRPHR
jgi:hypothetical protein